METIIQFIKTLTEFIIVVSGVIVAIPIIIGFVDKLIKNQLSDKSKCILKLVFIVSLAILIGASAYYLTQCLIIAVSGATTSIPIIIGLVNKYVFSPQKKYSFKPSAHTNMHSRPDSLGKTTQDIRFRQKRRIKSNKAYNLNIYVDKLIKNQLSDKSKRILKLVFIVSLVILIGASACYVKHRPSLHISSPSNGDVVDMEEQITGIAKNIPEGSEVWVVIRIGKIYYPQSDFTIDKDGSWVCNARFGGVNDDGKDFEIIVLFADRDANNEFMNKGEFTSLPTGAKEYDRITVTRASYDKPSVTITYPKNGATVNREQQVRGTSENVPEGSTVWIVIYVVNRYYPQPDFRIDNTGSWTCNALIGIENNYGKDFDVIALVADKNAHNELVNNGELTSLPIGAKEYDRITVTRETNTTPSISTQTPTQQPTSTPTPSPTPTPAIPSATIISPINTDVGMWEWVSGTSKNIPVGQELWVVVKVDGLYFPHRVETLNADGTWRHNVQIGQKAEGGKLFELIAVLADSSAQKELREWYKNQDDLYDLPSGTTRYSTVTVTRSVENFGDPSVTIRSPSNADKVGICEWVNGTSQNIPYGYQLWVVVRWDELYFPMYDGIKINADGTWMYNTTIGQTYDGGRDFEIIVVLADGSAQEMISEWHQNPYDLYRLFPGMTQYSAVTVMRK